jgi:DNA-binding NtrC family response regulator
MGRVMVASRVLLVEDEFLIRSVMADELRDQGYEVIEAETGDEAAQLLERESFDLLLTDVRMPGRLDGIDLAHRARRVRPTLPVLVVSGYAEQISARLESLKRPMAFVAKPFAMGRILGSIRTLTAPERS